MLKQAHLYIKGDVVGVGFRAWSRIQAKIIGVNGWVKNVFDKPNIFDASGGVEVVIQGDEKNVNAMVEVLKKGMYQNQIKDVDIFFEDPKIIFENFEIKR